MSEHKPAVIVALDVSERNRALHLARILRPATDWIKVGLELFTALGPDIISNLKEMKYRIFLDLKLMDIPNTVARAVHNCMEMDVDMLTLHLLGGKRMAEAAIQARKEKHVPGNHKPLLVGVTLLTSLERTDLPWPENRELNLGVLDLATKARAWGLDGVVCSGLEAAQINLENEQDFCLVTPGIRHSESAGDQKRTSTPAQASTAGATHLVVGRPVTDSPDPVKAILDIKAELYHT